MGSERRQHPRLVRPFDATWRGASGSKVCRLMDISVGGCFVQALAMPHIGEHTSITVTVAEKPFELSGQVVHIDPGMGFSVQFIDVSPETRADLEEAIKALSG